MPSGTNWTIAIQPLLRKYKGQKHPLDYKNTYQLLVMVILSAQDADKHINQLATEFFKSFPNMSALSKETVDTLMPHMNKVRNFRNKANWLVKLSKEIKKDSNIPLTLEKLTQLPGIGRKSANVILRESGMPAEGVIVDLHTVRVAPRLGIVTSTDPVKIEKELITILPQKDWDAGMAMSFLGREICRPKPICEICIMRKVCRYYNNLVKS